LQYTATTATHHNIVQCLRHTAKERTTLHHVEPHFNKLHQSPTLPSVQALTLHHKATHSNTPQHTAFNCNTLQHSSKSVASASYWKCHVDGSVFGILQLMATHCNTLQHTATHCNTLQHTVSQSSVFGTLASEPIPSEVPHRHECLATELYECKADHCGSALAATAAPLQMNSTVRLSIEQLCMTRKNATKERVHSDRDKRLEACRTGTIYICIYMYVYFYVHICIVRLYLYVYSLRTKARTRTRTHAHARTHSLTRTCTQTCARAHTHIYMHAHTHAHARTHARTQIYTYTHKINICTHTHTHTGREKALETTR